MKTKTVAWMVMGLAASALLSLGQNQQGQSVLDLLRSIQPGQTPVNSAPSNQGAPAAVSQPTPVSPATPAAATLDPQPVFMSIVTNHFLVTNRVIVTNYVVVTNLAFTTNYYNAQGQLLTLIGPPKTATPPARTRPSALRTAPDPATIRSNQVLAIRELLSQSLSAASNTLSAPGSFTANPSIQIQIPEGVTVFDRKKGQALTTAMNRAAENAAPAAFALVQKAVAQLNPPDPALVVQGNSDAATRQLLDTEGQNLANQILAAVQTSASEAKVAEAYNGVMLRGGGLLGAVFGSSPAVDINSHITRGLMQAIFLNLTTEENRIRTDPAARKTRALRNAFAK